MRTSFLLMAFFISTILAFSQDVIVRSNEENIKCKITKVDSTNVFFTFQKNGTDISTSIMKSDVKDIRYGASLMDDKIDSLNSSKNLRNCITIGILEGGGSLIGVDYEFLVSDNVGLQVGAGLVGFGGGLNIHFKPTIRSTFLALQYWHQGVGASFTQSVFGPSLVFRGRKWFTCQIGLGFPLEKGPAYPSNIKQPAVMLTYAIGGYKAW